MTGRRLTRRQVLRRRRIVVLTGLLLVVLGVSAVLVRAGQAVWAVASDAFSTASAVAAAGPDAPARIAVPSIGLDHELVPGGLDDTGAINPDRGEVAWYQGGDRAVPGGEGIAIVAGHVTYYDEPDTFFELDAVQEGDEVTITQQDGDELELTVVQVATVGKEELRTSDLVWGDEPDRRLVALVTCDDAQGFRADGHRAANHVVVAEVTG